MEREFKKGDIVKHFKRETVSEEELKTNPNKYLYEIVGVSCHTETKELLMIYKPLYEVDSLKGQELAARPYDMFASEVDHVKYPDIKQKYRFERLDD